MSTGTFPSSAFIDRRDKLRNADDVKTAATRSTNHLLYHSLNVTDEIAITETLSQIVPTLRYPLKGLVSCAGLSRNGPATDFPASEFRQMLDVNVAGSFLMAQAVAREMVRTNTSGSMVLVASVSGYVSNKVSMVLPLSIDI